ncbi:MAG: hypothetical protein KDA69_05075 [Planctomycetaceae bacterium]|nr:hypothetical protein [Planctomycetaceae bacterium]MCA9043670.1 hypothetical protein [Planctomycetaceae bacterium]MCB9951786.1 hypothetical protein [Planctomycetaceae bacterium]
MSGQRNASGTIELSTPTWAAIILTGLGGFVLLMFLIMGGITLAVPPENPPNIPVLIAIGVGSVSALALGIYLLWNSPVVMRLTEKELQFSLSGHSIPWEHIKAVEAVALEREEPGPVPHPVLIIYLTKAGRSLMQGVNVSTSNEHDRFNPPPDVCMKVNFNSFGPDNESCFDLATEFMRRARNARGTKGAATDDDLPLPDMDGPLRKRDMSQTGASSRVYIHDICRQGTVISGTHFHWAANPFRYTGGGTMCSNCGIAMDNVIRWEDTGETLSRFRSRMWRQTSGLIKFVQLLLIPAIVGVVTGLLLPMAPNIEQTTGYAVGFGLGFLVTELLFYLSPAGDVLPMMFGMRYNEYE